jgi:hypothetical protein
LHFAHMMKELMHPLMVAFITLVTDHSVPVCLYTLQPTKTAQ